MDGAEASHQKTHGASPHEGGEDDEAVVQERELAPSMEEESHDRTEGECIGQAKNPEP